MDRGFENKVGVDLVGYQECFRFLAQPADPLQFFPCPHPSHGVMRTAKEQDAIFPVFEQVLQAFKVHSVITLLVDEGVFHHFPAVVPHDPEKGWIDRGLDDHSVAGIGKSPDGSANGGHDSSTGHDPGGIRFPAMGSEEPVRYSPKDPRGSLYVAVHSVKGPPLDGLYDLLRGKKIHIRHPHGQGIPGNRTETPFHPIPFEAVGLPPFNNIIERKAIQTDHTIRHRSNLP